MSNKTICFNKEESDDKDIFECPNCFRDGKPSNLVETFESRPRSLDESWINYNICRNCGLHWLS